MTRRPRQPGDHVFVRGWPPVSLEVIDATTDPSLITLQSDNGTRLKVGRLMILRPTEQPLEAT